MDFAAEVILHKRDINQNIVFRLVAQQRTYYSKEHVWLDFPFQNRSWFGSSTFTRVLFKHKHQRVWPCKVWVLLPPLGRIEVKRVNVSVHCSFQKYLGFFLFDSCTHTHTMWIQVCYFTFVNCSEIPPTSPSNFYSAFLLRDTFMVSLRSFPDGHAYSVLFSEVHKVVLLNGFHENVGLSLWFVKQHLCGLHRVSKNHFHIPHLKARDSASAVCLVFRCAKRDSWWSRSATAPTTECASVLQVSTSWSSSASHTAPAHPAMEWQL